MEKRASPAGRREGADSRGVSLETTMRGLPLQAMSRMREERALVAGESSMRSVAETKRVWRAGEVKGRCEELFGECAPFISLRDRFLSLDGVGSFRDPFGSFDDPFGSFDPFISFGDLFVSFGDPFGSFRDPCISFDPFLSLSDPFVSLTPLRSSADPCKDSIATRNTLFLIPPPLTHLLSCTVASA